VKITHYLALAKRDSVNRFEGFFIMKWITASVREALPFAHWELTSGPVGSNCLSARSCLAEAMASILAEAPSTRLFFGSRPPHALGTASAKESDNKANQRGLPADVQPKPAIVVD
jgi:hypothetical protein